VPMKWLVTPAKAGVQSYSWVSGLWIPACAGMTTS